MAYTTIKKPSDYFNTKLYTGTGANQSITGVNFQPDFTWIKIRSIGYNHRLQDSVRGATKSLYSNLTNSEQTNTDGVLSFDTDGFSLGNDVSNGSFNSNGNTFASWNWLAANGTSANTDGSISSTVSANTTSGFSVVTFTGNSGTVGHGLGVKPDFIVVKSRQTGGSNNWVVAHSALGTNMNDNYIVLNLTSAAGSGSNTWGGEPTTTTFTVSSAVAANDNNIAYCFASKTGYSKFGSYTGNGSTDGTFVYTGFKPAFILVKQTNSTASWTIIDNKRDSFNVTEKRLFPDDANEEVVSANGNTDFLSNGVKMRIGHANINASGSTYIYMAFAEEPLVGDNPATAR